MQAWGQPTNTPAVTRYARTIDPTRLFSAASGWASGSGQIAGSDVLDRHDYAPAGSVAFLANDTANEYVNVIGEYGGISPYIPDHMQYKTFYGPSRLAKATTAQDFLGYFDTQAASIIRQAQDPNIGVSAAIFTETTDVGFDITGLATFDREIVKVNVTAMAITIKGLTSCI